MTTTTTRLDATLAPCGQRTTGERIVTEDQHGLITEHTSYDCGCRSSKEEYHDGSVHFMLVHHKGKVLVDQLLSGG